MENNETLDSVSAAGAEPQNETPAPAPEGGEAAPSPKKISNMKKRVITGACYVAVLVAFFLLKIFVHKLFFDALLLFFAVVGTLEMTRAFKDKLHLSQVILVMTFAVLIVTAYAVSDFYFQDVLKITLPEDGVLDKDTLQALTGRNYSMHITFGVMITGIAIIMSLLVVYHEKVSLESTGYALMCLLYPSFFITVLSVCNHLVKYSEMAVLLVFVICPVADSLALVFGKSLGKKFPAKMAPHVSPKKTIIGGFGGLVGGAVGAVMVFFACYGLSFLDGISFKTNLDTFNLVFFIALGILTSAFSQFGDLVESAVKRKLKIKDMGKLLPGHGGVLDRIDSSLYAGLVVSLAMVARIMIVG